MQRGFKRISVFLSFLTYLFRIKYNENVEKKLSSYLNFYEAR